MNIISIFKTFIEYLVCLCFRLKKEVGAEAYIAIHFLFKFIECAHMNREVLENYIPEMLLNQLECLANKI